MIELFPSSVEVLRIGVWSVRWYGVFYLAAFGLVYWWGRALLRWRDIQVSDDDWLLVVTAGIAGALVGGRLGYVFFYEAEYFLNHSIEIFQLWDGGMSWHGGLIGVSAALWWASRRLLIDWFRLTDVLVVPIAFGLALGRVGNWLNGELFADNMALVASAALIGVGLASFWLLRNGRKMAAPTAMFLIGYSVQRLVLEMWRIDGWESWGFLTRGQWFTLPVLATGVWLFFRVLADRS